MKDRVLELVGKMTHARTLTLIGNPTLESHEKYPLKTNVMQYEKEVVTPIKEFTSRPLLDTTHVVHVECKEITPDSKDSRKKVASPKEPPSWIKPKIYNTGSKAAVDKEKCCPED